MSKTAAIFDDDQRDDQANLTPMIDCVFLLLLFFIVTAAFVEQTNLFRVDLPRAARATEVELTELAVINIAGDGRYSFDEQIVSDTQLWQRIAELNERKPIATLVIRGDRECPYEKVVAALDMAQSLEIANITLAVAK